MPLSSYVTIQGQNFIINDASLEMLGVGEKVDRPAGVLPQNTTVPIFSVNKRILLTNLIGEVTVELGAVATNLKVQANPTVTGASVDLCADLAVATKVLGTLFSLTGTVADALQSGLAVVGMTKPIIVQAGTIDLVTNANDTGSVKWSLYYVPLETGVIVAPL